MRENISCDWLWRQSLALGRGLVSWLTPEHLTDYGLLVTAAAATAFGGLPVFVLTAIGYGWHRRAALPIIRERSTPRAPLTVTEISSSEYQSVRKTLDVWRTIACTQSKKSCEPTQPKYSHSSQIFSDCSSMAWSVSLALEHRWQGDRFFFCKDAGGCIQAVMILNSQNNQVDILRMVTHPHNIRSPLNEDKPNRVQGAGSALLKTAEKIAEEMNKTSCRLESLPSAENFYLKKGYTKDGKYMTKLLVGRTLVTKEV